MAKIKLGIVVTDIRGSINGVTFSRGRGGAIARTKVTPVNANTPRQAAARQAFAQNARDFSNVLTDGQRAAYKSLAENNPVTNIFGDTNILTAIALFGSVNNVRRNLDLASLSDAPVDLNVTGINTLAVVSSVATTSVAISFTDTPLPATHRLYIFATGNLGPGVNFFKPKLRFIGSSAAADISPFDAGTLWEAKFGPLVEGKKFGIAVATVNETNGAVSVALQEIVTIAA